MAMMRAFDGEREMARKERQEKQGEELEGERHYARPRRRGRRRARGAGDVPLRQLGVKVCMA